MTKLKIDLSSGQIEVEGDEKLANKVYDDFKDQLRETKPLNPQVNFSQTSDGKDKTTSSRVRRPQSSSGPYSRKESWTLVKDLDLRGKSGEESLKSFFAKKAPSTSMEKNAVFVYYLNHMRKMSGIRLDHIYTCYKEVGQPVPGALKQSMYDTAHRAGSIDTASMSDIKGTTIGENLVEHDLPRKKEGKAAE